MSRLHEARAHGKNEEIHHCSVVGTNQTNQAALMLCVPKKNSKLHTTVNF
jgi:hypothetical protein